MRLAIVFAVLMVLCARPLWAQDPFTFSSGGIVRFPNSQQAADEGNVMLEGWAKLSYQMHQSRWGELSFFLRGKYVADTARYDFNNSETWGLGLAYKVKPGDKSSLTFSVRHDWYQRQLSPTQNYGWRFLIDYFYLDYRPERNGRQMWGLDRKATIFKIWANLTYPDTLNPGDNNTVFTSGAELGTNLILPESKWYVTPFWSLNLSMDSDNNAYNNKVQPGLGVKIRYPLPNGDVHVGVRYRGDYRWGPDSFESGPGVFVGWYTAF